jgi:cytochrome c biogenesis protein CcmG/thiol:disulfide interchange protein DsbE
MAIADPVNRRRLLMLGPLALAGVAGGAFLAMLMRMQEGKFDPRAVPNPLVGKAMPDFDLPAQAPATTGFSSRDVRAAGRPVLVNFFASWCVPCVVEAPVLDDLKEAGIPIWGIAYKDQAAAAQNFLARHGDPYQRLARDEPGRVAIDFGVYGVPETYFIDRAGIVRWRWAGPLTPDSVTRELQPLLQHYA